MDRVSQSLYRVGIYVRQSRDENEENKETIETQKELLIKYTRDKGLGEIYKIYMDDNVSGTTFERAAIKELEEDILNGKVNLLLIKDLSRLGRNNAKTLLFLDFLEENGVRVLCSDGRYDSVKDSDLVGIETWFNERYAKDISRKIRANLKHKISKGEYIGKAPYGYIKSQINKNTLEVNQEQASIVKRIYSYYIEDDLGYANIAKLLNNENVRPPGGKSSSLNEKRWNAVAIQRILTNRVYLGDTIQGVSEKISFKTKKTRRLPQNEWCITKNTHKSIIEKDIFYQVQEKIKSKNSNFSGTHKSQINCFTGLLYCGRCNSLLYARKRTGRASGYVCSNYVQNGPNECSSHFIREDELFKIIVDELILVQKNEVLLSEVADLLNKFSFKNNSETVKEKIYKQIESKVRQQEELYMDKLEGKISEELFLRMNKIIEEQINRLRNQKEIEDKITEFKDPKVLLQEVVDLANSGDFPHSLVKMLIHKITIFDGRECLQRSTCGENILQEESIGLIEVEFNY